MRSLVYAAVFLALGAQSAMAQGACVDCSHRGGKGVAIVQTHEAHPFDWSPYSDNRRASGKGYGIVPAGHVLTCYTRECAPYTHPSMPQLGGNAGTTSHSVAHGK
jgi:hypothetical protein